MKTASTEIRTVVVNAYTSGVATRKQLAEIFGYHIKSIDNWIRESERGGQLAPRPKGHRKSIFTDEEKQMLIRLLKNNASMTLEELRDYLGKDCSLTTIHNTIVKLGFVYKKNAQGVGVREYSPNA